MSENKKLFTVSMIHNVRVADDDDNTLSVTWEYKTSVMPYDNSDIKEGLLLKALEQIVNTEKLKIEKGLP